jgi:hypothetical protein
VEVSAMNANNISEAFEILARSVLKRLTDLPFEKKKVPVNGTNKLSGSSNNDKK